MESAATVPVSFDELFRRHGGEALRFSMKLTGNAADAEDLAQEGFARALRGLDGFRGGAEFRTWLFAILANGWRDVLRRRARARAVPPPEAAPEPGDAGELRALLERRIEALPPRQREVLRLHLEGRLDYAGIAAALGISRDDVKANLCLARRRLREELREVVG